MSRSAEKPVRSDVPSQDVRSQPDELLRRIRFFCDPQEVWLFGSRVHCGAREGSDRDVLVVVDDAAPAAVMGPAIAWRLQRGAGVHADIDRTPAALTPRQP